jgi:hypothetical protein
MAGIGSGTSFGMRLKTLTNKLVPVYSARPRPGAFGNSHRFDSAVPKACSSRFGWEARRVCRLASRCVRTLRHESLRQLDLAVDALVAVPERRQTGPVRHFFIALRPKVCVMNHWFNFYDAA